MVRTISVETWVDVDLDDYDEEIRDYVKSVYGVSLTEGESDIDGITQSITALRKENPAMFETVYRQMILEAAGEGV